MARRKLSNLTNTLSPESCGLPAPAAKNHVTTAQNGIVSAFKNNAEDNHEAQSDYRLLSSQLQSQERDDKASREQLTLEAEALEELSKTKDLLARSDALIASVRYILVRSEEEGLTDTVVVEQMKSLLQLDLHRHTPTTPNYLEGENPSSETTAYSKTWKREASCQQGDNKSNEITIAEDAEESFDTASLSETPPTPSTRDRKAQRRRTVAFKSGVNLLAGEATTSPVSSPDVPPPSTQTEECYYPSSSSSSKSTPIDTNRVSLKNRKSTPEDHSNVKVGGDKTKASGSDATPLRQVVNPNPTAVGDNDLATAQSCRVQLDSPDANNVCENDRDGASSSQSRPPLRRSRRRRTMAIHYNGTVLLPSVSSATPPPTGISRKSSSGSRKGAEQLHEDRVRVETPMISRKAVSSLKAKKEQLREDSVRVETPKISQKEESSKKVKHAIAGSSTQVGASRKALPPRRPRRNTILPEKLRNQDVVLGYTPQPVEKGVISETISQMEDRGSALRDASEKIVVGTTAEERASKTVIAAMPVDTRETITLQPVESTEQRVPKTRKKRRSSIGLHVTGGLITPQDIEGVIQASKSITARKRRRRTLQEYPSQNVEAPGKANPEPVDGSIAQKLTEALTVPNIHGNSLSSQPSEEGDRLEQATPAPDRVCNSDSAVNKDEDTSGSKEPVAHVSNKPTESRHGTDCLEATEIEEDTSRSTTCVSTVSTSDVSDRIRLLFANEDTINTTCMSSRLFACFTLATEKSRSLTDQDKKIRTRRTLSTQHVEPLLPLLRLLVRVEMISLRDTSHATTTHLQKRVHFCNIGCSSTETPVDSMAGSHLQLENGIEALRDVLEETHTICRKYHSERGSSNHAKEVVVCLKSLIRFLNECENDSGELSFARAIRQACSQSMPCKWPEERFRSASASYHRDFDAILSALNNDDYPVSNHLNLDIEKRLGDFLGGAIRYYLRKFFNPLPPLPTKDQPTDSSVRSRVHEIVEVAEEADEGRDTAVADGSVSSVFSFALRQVYHHFGAQYILSEDFAPRTPNEFFSSEASRRGAGTKLKPVLISDEDLEQVLSDIDDAYSFLAASKACKFLSELMNWPGVKEAIEAVGGWTRVERYAGMIADLHLEHADDSHFVLLRDVDLLTKRAEQVWNTMEPAAARCEGACGLLWKKCRCGTRIKQVLEENPNISKIKAAIKKGKGSSQFPCLVQAEK